MRFSILYDSRAAREGMLTGWGFSCMVETGETSLLFDTGGNGDRLLSNMLLMGKAASHVRALVLSHRHPDHTGGAEAILRYNRSVDVLVPESFPGPLKERLRPPDGSLVEVGEEYRITPRISSTGEMGRLFKEQSLILEADHGLVVLMGCAHPGVVRIVRKARDRGADKPIMLIGGFHMMEKFSFQIKREIAELRRLGVTRVAPCHCAAGRARRLLQEAYGEGFTPAGVGSILQA